MKYKIQILTLIIILTFSFGYCSTTVKADTDTYLSMHNNLIKDYKGKRYKLFEKMFLNEVKKGTNKKKGLDVNCSYNQLLKYINRLERTKYFAYTEEQLISTLVYYSSYDTNEIVAFFDFGKVQKIKKDSEYNKSQVKKAVKKLKLNKNVKEKDAAMKICKYLGKICDYDYSYSKTDAKDCFKGKGVCSAYARAYYLVSNYVGLKCKTVSGNGNSNGKWMPHQWNRVKVNNSWYYIDPTWYDTTSKYYLSKTLWKDHTR